MQLGKPCLCLSILVTFALGLACSKKLGGENADGSSGASVGVSCQRSTECRTHLACDSTTKTCVPNADVIQGGACDLSAECLTGNYCTQQGLCAPSGKGAAGAVCSSEGDCASGLLCAQTGLTGVCQKSGPGDVGRGCVQTAECMAGLLCIAGVCSEAINSPWAGLACPDEDTVPRVYFHVPRASDVAGTGDFYRLPFPNDIRIKNGLVSLAGHPKPGRRILPIDVVDEYLSAIEAESTGFGANQAVYFRLSKAFNTTSFPPDCGSDLVDITPGSPTYGLSPGLRCGAQISRSTYVCGPYLWVRPPVGSPLRPGTTYAAVVKKNSFVDLAGATFGPDDDFTTMLGAVPPSDSDLAAAYAAYRPLRDYLVAAKDLTNGAAMSRFAAEDLIAGAVFTVEKYEDPLAAIDNAIASISTPEIAAVVHCGDPGVISPCDDGQAGSAHVRGCLPADAAGPSFDTYQGTISLPIFQQGNPPYLTPADGGNIQYEVASDGGGAAPDLDGGGAYDGGAMAIGPALTAVVQRTEKVCFSLTVPKGVAPASGWPLVVYGHGTGGSYRSIVDLGLGQDFADGNAPAGLASTVGATPVPMATLGYDGIMHGTRAGGSTKPVGELVYNFLNPRAARDNALQAAADLLAIPRAVPALAAQGIPIDAKRLALYGHSQGGNGASLVAARQSSYRTIVMSGTGGMLIYTLLGKTQPVNIPAVLPYVLGETGPVDASNPVLNLMQMYFERSDSVNFGRRLFGEPLAGMTPHHILHVLGTNDSYSVIDTQQAYALSAPFQVALPVVDNFGLPPIAPPVRNNQFFGQMDDVTAVELQYQPTAAYDGHFVSTQNPSARAAIQQMLVTTFRDGIPTVSP
jgi:predicted esterase